MSLIYLGWESCVVYMNMYVTVLCPQAIPILSASFLCQPYIPLSNSKCTFLPFSLWSVMIVECILWCRLVYIHAKKSDGIYCIPLQVIVFALSLYEVQCFMNMHFLIVLCTKVCYYGNFVFKNMKLAIIQFTRFPWSNYLISRLSL